jgi:hypothetical protein
MACRPPCQPAPSLNVGSAGKASALHRLIFELIQETVFYTTANSTLNIKVKDVFRFNGLIGLKPATRFIEPRQGGVK